MKIYKLIIIQLLLFLCIKYYAQDQNWFFQYPRNTSNTINSALILSDSKTLLGTDAGGLFVLDRNNIKNLKHISEYNIIDIERFNSSIFYCLTYSNYLNGYKNQILKSTDRGETWFEVYSGEIFLRDMCVVDSLNIIAVGLNSEVHFSSDGGTIWNTEHILAYDANFYTIKKTRTNNIYIGGVNKLLTSHDYGKTWSEIESNILPSTILNIENGIKPGDILISGKWGGTIKYSESDSSFQNFATGYYGYDIVKTSIIDKEIFAIAQYTPSTQKNKSSILKYNSSSNSWDEILEFDFLINDIQKYSDHENLFFGEAGIFGLIEKESKNYKFLNNDTRNKIVGISFVDELNGWALSEKGELLKTVNSGNEWNYFNNLGFEKFAGSDSYLNIQFINKNEGWITKHGILYITLDGGISWDSTEISHGRYKAIQFLNNKNGFIASDPTSILKTTDGGISWENYGLKNFYHTDVSSIEKLYFLNDSIGYAAGGYISGLDNYGAYIYNMLILKTITGGISWEILFESKSNGYLKSICFVDENIGYAIDPSYIYKTTNGGDSWSKSKIDRAMLNDIYFINSKGGWVTSWQGGIFKSDDSGYSWEKQPTLTNNNITEIASVNDSLIWFGGENGTIIRYGSLSNDSSNHNIIDDTSIRLYQNYPNPFNTITNIEFILLKNEYVELNIYNTLGEKIQVLISKLISGGHHFVKFNGKNYSSGIYFCQLKTSKYTLVKKMLLLK